MVAILLHFLRRAYDQIYAGCAILKLHVVLAVDRAGLVGEDGETLTHFDVGFLRQTPGRRYCVPQPGRAEADAALGIEGCTGPVAVRYPRGGDGTYRDSAWIPGMAARDGVLDCHRTGADVTLITYGTLLDNVMQAAELLDRQGIHATVLRLLTVAPLPVAQIVSGISARHHVVVVEEVCAGSGIRQDLAWELCHALPDCKVDGIDLGHTFCDARKFPVVYQYCGLDAQSIADYTREVLRHEG